MTGVLNALVAGGNGLPFTVTVADIGTGRGFLSGTAGVVSPTSLKGSSVRQVASNISPADFRFELSAVVAQSYFLSLIAIDHNGVPHRFRASAATFSNPGGIRSLWQWATDDAGAGGDTIWTVSSDGARQVIIYY